MSRIQKFLSGKPRLQQRIDAMQASAEDEFYMLNLADNTRLSPAQAPSLYQIVDEVATLAGMPMPHLFLDTQPDLNAWVLGGRNASMVLTSTLVDELTDAQLRAVVAHEFGHIACNHTFYRKMAEAFDPIAALASALPGGSLVALGLRWHLLDWYRKSELSADRFALLTTGDLEAIQAVILRLAGGSLRIQGELKNEQFRLQAEEFRQVVEERTRGPLKNKLEFYASSVMLQQAMSTHPWPAVRFVEIEEWATSQQYALILNGQLKDAEEVPTQFVSDTAPAGGRDGEEDDTDAASEKPVLEHAASELLGRWRKRS